MRIYIAGPIDGMPDDNREAFEVAEEYLILLGHKPVNPHCIIPTKRGGTGICTEPKRSDRIRSDIAELVKCDAIYVLKGWRKSKGTKLELAIAIESGLEVIFEGE